MPVAKRIMGTCPFRIKSEVLCVVRMKLSAPCKTLSGRRKTDRFITIGKWDVFGQDAAAGDPWGIRRGLRCGCSVGSAERGRTRRRLTGWAPPDGPCAAGPNADGGRPYRFGFAGRADPGGFGPKRLTLKDDPGGIGITGAFRFGGGASDRLRGSAPFLKKM